MSLDTILHIGNVLKTGSKDPMQHYRHTKRPQAKDNIIYMSIDVRKVDGNWIFDWNNIREIPENEREKLYYLSFKTSDGDKSVGKKYIFGDIFFGIKGDTFASKKSEGNYNFYEGLNSFDRFFTYVKKNPPQKLIINDYIDEVVNRIKFNVNIDNIVSCIKNRNIEEKIDNTAKEVIKADGLLLFLYAFSRNIEKIHKLLRYAPVVFETKCSSDIEDMYIAFLFDNERKTVLQLIEKKDWKELDDAKKYSLLGGRDEKCIDDKEKEELLKNFNKGRTLQDLGVIEKKKLLDYINHFVFLHFNFIDGDNIQWYNRPEFKKSVYILNKEFSQKDNEGNIVLNKTIYPTLCSGDNKNDIQFPGFIQRNSYKSFFFTENTFDDLLYANEIRCYHRMWIKKSNINIYVFPYSRTQDIDAETYEDFFFKRESEASLLSFDFLNSFECDTSCYNICFDFVFCEKGQTDKYLLELSGLEKSKLSAIKENIETAESDVRILMTEELGWADKFLSVENAFLWLLGSCRFKDGKCDFEMSKFCESHLLKVLPQIYTDSYYSDDSLLHYLNNQVESICRNIAECRNTYNKLKYAFILLCNIQKHNKYIEIMSLQSFELGKILGRLAQPLGRKISSFQKNYVGLLSRRVATKDDCKKFANEINEKLQLHDCLYGRGDEISTFIRGIETMLSYDKDEFTFGFFDGYFKYDSNFTESLFVTRIEKLLSDYKDNEKTPDEFKEYISEMSELLDKMKTTIK